jgi:transcriptional regulator with XRE-family HTH domain
LTSSNGVLNTVITGRQTGARLLRRLRVSRGWSWADLARALQDSARRLGMASLAASQRSSIRRAVARWESVDDGTSPGERYQVVLAHVYACTPVGQVHLGPGSDFELLLEAFRYFDVPSARIQEILEVIATCVGAEGAELAMLLQPAARASVAAAERGRSHIDEVIPGLQDAVVSIDRQVGVKPFVRLQLQLAPVVDACRLLSSQPGGQTADLPKLAATTFALAARLAFETRDDETAMGFYAEATEAAGGLMDRSLRAMIRTSQTMVMLHATGDHRLAREIARAATVDAHRGSSYAVRARAHAVHAEINARAGQPKEAAEAIGRAWTTVEQLSVDDPHRGFDGERLRGFDGLCALHAGDAGHAHGCLERSLDSLRTSRDAVQRGIVTSDLALARLKLGDPQACAADLHDAIDVASATGGRVATQRVRLVRQALRPWRTEDFVAELDDHLHDTLIGR